MRHSWWCVLALVVGLGAAETNVLEIVPKPNAPFVLAKKEELDAVKRKVEAYMSKPVQEVKAHPAAKYFPGEVTSSERVTREVTFNYNTLYRWDPKAPNAPWDTCTPPDAWQETGLYAAPGEIVKVDLGEIPKSRQVSVIIGCHTDGLFEDVKEKRKITWNRFPLISREFKLTAGVNQIANAFGGQIFIWVKPKDDAKAGLLKPANAHATMTFSHAVAMPVFHEHRDTLATWKKTLAESPAPWGDIVSQQMILHLPREVLEQIADPKAVILWWDKVIETEDDLVNLQRHAPERVVPDKQIDGGYLHSGYPFMCHLDPHAHEMIDLEKLRKEGSWGFFHELGHNHQNPKWTFKEKNSDQIEVTCNLFSMYCMEKISGVELKNQHPDFQNLDKLLSRRFGNPPNMEPFEQLSPFVLLIRTHGWEPMREVLRSYAKPLDEGIKDEPALQNLFVQRYGMAAKSNVAPFFAKMGYPITKATKAQLQAFPLFDPPLPK